MNPGRLLIIAGVILIAIGVLLTVGERLPFKPGQLPGDIVIRGKNSVFYIPLTTSIILSLFLSAILWVMGRNR